MVTYTYNSSTRDRSKIIASLSLTRTALKFQDHLGLSKKTQSLYKTKQFNKLLKTKKKLLITIKYKMLLITYNAHIKNILIYSKYKNMYSS